MTFRFQRSALGPLFLLPGIAAASLAALACGQVIVGEKPDGDAGETGDDTSETGNGGKTEANSGGGSNSSGAGSGGSNQAPSTPPVSHSCFDDFRLGSPLVKLREPAENPSTAISTADVNQDGRLDWLVTTETSIGVRLQNNAGEFEPLITSPLEQGPFWSPQLVDVDGDGTLDLFGIRYEVGDFNVFLGDGLGRFELQKRYKPGNLPVAAEVVDFNRDGWVDAAVVNQNENTVRILLGREDGSFSIERWSWVGNTPTSVRTGDFNGDQNLDLVVANLNDDVSVLLGRGDGTFNDQNRFAAGHLAYITDVKDLNDDGALDLVVANGCTPSDPPAVSVLLGRGDGSFDPPTSYLTNNCVGVVPALDIDDDGILDLVTSTGPMRGNGDGTFQAEEIAISYGYLQGTGDLDGDGMADLALSRGNDFGFIEKGNGDGTFGDWVLSDLVDGAFAVARILDMTGDGISDVVLLKESSLVVGIGAGDGTFTRGTEATLEEGIGSFEVAELNNDGKPDLVIGGSYDQNTFTALLAQDDGTFAATTYPVPAGITRVAIQDLNGDDVLDLFVVTSDVSSGPTATVTVFRGLGDGSFEAEAGETHPIAGPPRLVDINGDGHADAILNAYTESYVMFGNGDLTFDAPQPLADSLVVAASDLNEDGVSDLVLRANEVSSVALGNGDGTFGTERTIYPSDSGNWSDPVVLDLDSDGHLDIALGDVLLRGAGDGTFPCADLRALGLGSLGDLNGDGKVDLVRSPTGADGSLRALLARAK